jgi:hypothetical protein
MAGFPHDFLALVMHWFSCHYKVAGNQFWQELLFALEHLNRFA